MSAAAADELLARLAAKGLPEAEVYLKAGRSRRFELAGGESRVAAAEEQGWAVRAGDSGSSLFACGSGLPAGDLELPDPLPGRLRLPRAAAVPPWRPPGDLEAPLIGEREALGLLRGVAAEVEREAPRARLLRAALEDGSSEVEIASSHGIRASYRSRSASLFLEAAQPESRKPAVALYLAERAARGFSPQALARRLADRLLVTARGRFEGRDRGEMLLAPAVGVELLAAMLPLLVGPGASRLGQRFLDRRGRLGAAGLSIVDDGRLPGGILEAPVDGEGSPTREVILLEEGVFRQPLLDWRQARAAGLPASGCVRRASWRDLPSPGPSHLFIRPDRGVAVRALVDSVARGFYLMESEGSARFDWDEDRFEVPVSGFRLQQGKGVAPVAGALLCGRIGSLLHGVQAVGRDLAFLPRQGMLGAPTLLVTGLELRQAA